MHYHILSPNDMAKLCLRKVVPDTVGGRVKSMIRASPSIPMSDKSHKSTCIVDTLCTSLIATILSILMLWMRKEGRHQIQRMAPTIRIRIFRLKVRRAQPHRFPFWRPRWSNHGWWDWVKTCTLVGRRKIMVSNDTGHFVMPSKWHVSNMINQWTIPWSIKSTDIYWIHLYTPRWTCIRTVTTPYLMPWRQMHVVSHQKNSCCHHQEKVNPPTVRMRMPKKERKLPMWRSKRWARKLDIKNLSIGFAYRVRQGSDIVFCKRRPLDMTLMIFRIRRLRNVPKILPWRWPKMDQC